MVERFLPKEDVAGSNPVSRSRRDTHHIKMGNSLIDRAYLVVFS